jgi:hypothetical protein
MLPQVFNGTKVTEQCVTGETSPRIRDRKGENPSTPQGASDSDASEAEKDKKNPYTSFEASDRTLRVHVKGSVVTKYKNNFLQRK